MGRKADALIGDIADALDAIARGNVADAENILQWAVKSHRRTAHDPSKIAALADWLKIDAPQRPDFEEYLRQRAAKQRAADAAWAEAIAARKAAYQS